MEAWTGPTETHTVELAIAAGSPRTHRRSCSISGSTTSSPAGHVRAARNIGLGSLTDHLPQLPDGPVLVMCGNGERAMSAASIFAASGRREIQVLKGGPGEYARAVNGRDRCAAQ